MCYGKGMLGSRLDVKVYVSDDVMVSVDVTVNVCLTVSLMLAFM